MSTHSNDTRQTVREATPYRASMMGLAIQQLIEVLDDQLAELEPAVADFATRDKSLHADIDVEEFCDCRESVTTAAELFAGITTFLDSECFLHMFEDKPKLAE
ncbi:MAG: hypothetical protein Q4B10_03305 [Actinomycetaceae bacterium]|nr:hypothetical protein [Actinomycetaceae bacterium]